MIGRYNKHRKIKGVMRLLNTSGQWLDWGDIKWKVWLPLGCPKETDNSKKGKRIIYLHEGYTNALLGPGWTAAIQDLTSKTTVKVLGWI